jgi:predicted nuclease of restriction endonuclease-like (RecB) superfamily
MFYEEWNDYLNSAAMATELPHEPNIVSSTDLLRLTNRQPLAANLNLDEFISLSFTHHVEILTKAKNVTERLFYIHQSSINQWNKYHLREMLKADLFHHQASLPNNFSKSMPNAKTALQAIEMFKDEYLLDFINVEELGERDKTDIDEREVEQAIIHNVKNFIMTFGHDFTFVGNQYHLEKYGHDSYPDLLFYNRELAALVVVELKRGEFKPAYLGQLSAYLRILDTEIKKPFENPSIGIVLCKQADKSYVEFLIQGYDNPMGVATYKTAEDVRKILPSEDELRRVMDDEEQD